MDLNASARRIRSLAGDARKRAPQTLRVGTRGEAVVWWSAEVSI